MLVRLYTKEHEELGGKFASVDVQMGKRCNKIPGDSATTNFTEFEVDVSNGELFGY